MQQPSVSVPTMPFFPDFNVPKTEPLDFDLDLDIDLEPIHQRLAAAAGAPVQSTPSDTASASVPWSTGPGGLEIPTDASFSMPLAPSTNDDQFDAWLAMLFPPVENVGGMENVGLEQVGSVGSVGGSNLGVGGVADEWTLDPNAWNAQS